MTSAYRLKNIAFRYPKHLALSLSSLDIGSGQITALTGPNGSGKSTLLNILAFLVPPCSGEIRYFSECVPNNQLLRFRRRIGFLPQKPYMLHGTIVDNIRIALRLHGIAKPIQENKINAVLEQLHISHLANQQAKSLSGGELQKAALARIIALDPEVLILDEPFSFLDQASSQLLEDFFLAYRKETRNTLIFSTHNRLQGLALADQVISLINGKPIATPLINLYHGTINNNVFNTGKITITLPGNMTTGNHISIDPHEIVISRQALASSIRNCFCGRIITIAEENGNVRIGIDAGEIFQALITHAALKELKLHLSDSVWVNFKSNSVKVF